MAFVTPESAVFLGTNLVHLTSALLRFLNQEISAYFPLLLPSAANEAVGMANDQTTLLVVLSCFVG